MLTYESGVVLALLLVATILLVVIMLTYHLYKKPSQFKLPFTHSHSQIRSSLPSNHSNTTPLTRYSQQSDSIPLTPTLNSNGRNILISTPILNSATSNLVDLESLRNGNGIDGNAEGINDDASRKSKKKGKSKWSFRSKPQVVKRRESISTSVSISRGQIELLSRIHNHQILRQSYDEQELMLRDLSLPPRFSSLSIYNTTNSSLPPSPTPVYSSEFEVLSLPNLNSSHDENEQTNNLDNFTRVSKEFFESVDLSSPTLFNSNSLLFSPLYMNQETSPIYSSDQTASPNIPLPSLPPSIKHTTTNNKFDFPPLPLTPSPSMTEFSVSDTSEPKVKPAIYINGSALNSSNNLESEMEEIQGMLGVELPMFKPEQVFNNEVH